MVEKYDKDKTEHSNTDLYEVVEYETVLDSVSEVCTIKEDSQKRDFTNSAVYYSLKTKELIDPNGVGIIDCLENRLHFIGNPKDRIREDPLRAVRTYKFIQRGWEATPKTLKATRENFAYALKEVSAERVRIELEKIVGLS